MTSGYPPEHPHPSEEVLAALIEGNLPPEERHSVDNHLQECRLCLAAYADVVRFRHNFTGQDEIVGIQTTRRSASQRGIKPWLVAACLPLAMATYFWGIAPGPASDLPRHIPVSLVQVLSQASEPDMVLPLTVISEELPAATTYRSGADDNFDYVSFLATLPRDRWDSNLGLQVASAALATGDLESAELLVDRANRESKSDPLWWSIDAVLAYRNSDLESAENLPRFAESKTRTKGGRGAPNRPRISGAPRQNRG